MKNTLIISGTKRVKQQNRYLHDLKKEMYPYLYGNNAIHFFRDLNEKEYNIHADELKKRQEQFLKSYQKETSFSVCKMRNRIHLGSIIIKLSGLSSVF
jgi:hypothetical protein